jgi:TolA-binding protein
MTSHRGSRIPTTFLALGLAFGLTLPARAAADATNAVPPELHAAVEAVKKGDEAAAWQLYAPHAAALAQHWEQLDGAFVTWVAEQLRKQKQYKEALDLCNQVLAKESALKPEIAAGLLLTRGDVFRDQENYSASRLEYLSIDRNKNYRSTPAGQSARFRIVNILRLTKDYDAAHDILDQLKDSPDPRIQSEAYFYSARIAFDRGANDEARELIEEVKKRNPEHIESLFLEAEINLRMDRLQDPELEIGSKVLTTYVVPGRPVTMKMQDRNLAVVRGGSGIPVKLTTSKGNDVEIVTLLPSPREPTLFRGTLGTHLGDAATNNMRLELMGEEVVSYNLLESFQKENDLQYPDKKMLVVADAELAASSGDFVSTDEREQAVFEQRIALALQDKTKKFKAFERQRNTTVIRPGNDIRVQVIDYDRDISPQADRLVVDAETSSGEKLSGIVLIETNAHGGVFRGQIPTLIAPPRITASDSAAGSDPNSIIAAQEGSGWTSAADGKKPKWLQVDLMSMTPLASAELQLADAAALQAVSLFAVSTSAMQQVASTAPQPQDIYGYVDLTRHFGNQVKTAAYLYTEITSGTETDAVFKIGSSDGVACWLNGVKVFTKSEEREWKPEEDAFNVRLKAGVNGVLLKITQIMGSWGASLTVLDTAGNVFPSLAVYPPAKPGVATQWHLFDRLTTEDIQVGGRVTVNKPVHIGEGIYRWVPKSVIPPASLTIASNSIKTVFHQTPGLRILRWSFDEFGAPALTAKRLVLVNRYGERVAPLAADGGARTNRALALSPGDRIAIGYLDERRVRGESLRLTATMNSGFFNGHVGLEYESITMNKQGEREFVYDPAVRYRMGKTETLVLRVVDFDQDVTSERDKVKALVESAAGEKLWLEALETEEHSGQFVAILKLGATTGADTIKVGPGVALKASYIDRENSDGQSERTATVAEAGSEPPELLLYQCLLIPPEKGITDDMAPILKIRLPAEAAETNRPVVTSLDTGLVFRVVYPAAALSSNATYEVQLATERELQAAQKDNRAPSAVKVKMRLMSAIDAEFKAEVELRTGEKKDYADEGLEAGMDNTPLLVEPKPVIYVRGDDVIRVMARTIDGGAGREGRFRLAGDGRLEFTDRKYEKNLDQVYVGDFIYLRLVDRDQDVSDELDALKVTLTGKDGSADVVLTETLPHAGSFTGRIKTDLAGAGGAGATGSVLRVSYGGTVQATYLDKVSVISAEPRKVVASAVIYKGADGTLATFTKHFTDPEIAVKTRLLMAEALFELAKEHRKSEQAMLAENEIGEGKAILSEAIADYPETKHAPQAEFLLANLAQELEHFEEALGRYNKVISSWPDSEYAPRSQLKKGICLEKLNDYDNALDAYVELTYSYPNSPLVPDAVIRLGQYFYRVKKYDIAGKIFGNFQAKNPQHELAAKALFLAGQSYLKGADDRKQELGGKYDYSANEWLKEAAEKFDRLIAAYDEKDLRAEAMYWLADSHLKLADMKNAYQTLKKLTWDYPESKWAKFARGQLVQNEAMFKVYEKED